ncbi:MAG: hypothetical protein JRH20_30730, partial [Deltaproteobacteria bacterium]|nr:hypothetical protein [Deltaproteobacteria bacterium]
MYQPIRTLLIVAMTLSVVACSDDSSSGGDASVQPDGMTDQVVQKSSATVQVFNAGGPLAEAPVVFHQEDGTSLTATDTEGKAEGETSANGAISALIESGKSRQVVTVLGVQPGDAVTIGDNRGDGATVSLEVTATIEVENATAYIIDVGCARKTIDASTMPTIEIPAWCAASGTVSVMMTSVRDDGSPHSYAFAKDVAVAATGVTGVTLSDWLVDWDGVALKLVNSPAKSTLMRSQIGTSLGGLTYVGYAPENLVIAYPGATALQLGAAVPESFTTITNVNLGVAFGDVDKISGESGIRYRDTTRPTAPAAVYTIEFDGGGLLPQISEVTVTPASGASPSVSWSAAGLEGHDGIVITLQYSETFSWHVLVPPDVTVPLTLPALPAEWRDALV